MALIQKRCWECGAELSEKELEGEGIVPFCPSCGEYRFPLYNVVVSMIVVNRATRKIILIKQYGHDFYILVAGYVSRGESLEHTVIREVKEETGMTADHIKFNRTHFFEPTNTLVCNFTVYVSDDSELAPNKEIDSYRWFTPDEARRNIKENSLAGFFLNAYLEECEANHSCICTDYCGEV